jgi:hypothetical protein
MVGEVKENEKAELLPSELKGRGKTSRGSKLHLREVMLVRRLWFESCSDYQIWKKYRIPIPVIQKTNKDIER